jgi:ribonuclease HI
MELTAVLDAVRSLGGPLEVVSDSTYVVNCFKQRWWVKWVANGWVGSTKKPVANRDLWEPLVELYREVPGRLEFRWVKGHGADPFNDLVDRLAVAAAGEQRGGEGERPPSSGQLGPADEVRRPGPAVVRTTIELPEDLYQEARSLALDRGTSVSEVMADLVRKGLGAARPSDHQCAD